MRWSADGWATSALAKATGNATVWDAVIAVPGIADANAGNDIAYYAFTSADADLAASGVAPDLAVLTANSNAGANYTLDVYNLANTWHIPDSAEPPTVTMRNPLDVDTTDDAVAVYNGNQYQGAGRVSDQSAMTLYYKKSTAGVWTSAVGAYDTADGNNKYWIASMTATGFAAGDIIQYYLKAEFTDREATFLYKGAGDTNALTGKEATARVAPWTFTVAGVYGQGYHTPSAEEPISADTMRDPLAPDTTSDTTVRLWFAEPDAGAINPIGQMRAYYRLGSGSWQQTANKITPDINNESGKDYFFFDIAINGQPAGATLEYYFYVAYKPAAGFDATYYHWSGGASTPAALQATAQAAPYSVTLLGPAIPTLGEWAMILALFCMALVAVRELKHRGAFVRNA